MKNNIKNKTIIGLAIFCFILMLGCLSIGLFVIDRLRLDKHVEENTTEYSATIVDVEKVEKDYLFTLEDFKVKILVKKEYLVKNYLVKDYDFYSLNGKNIVFKMDNVSNDFLQKHEVKQLVMVYLKIDETELITLNSVNEYTFKNEQEMKAALLILSGMLFVFFVYLTLFKLKNK